MPDRLTYALRYKAQGGWPLPCEPGLKKPLMKWAKLQRRPLNTAEMHDAWPNKNDNNIALVCGPAAHLLVLNLNRKNGVDGPALLQQRGLAIPSTPEIITPNDGRAFCFKVPAHDTPFRLYVYPDGWPGVELRGHGGIQVVPPSRTPGGAYRFAEGWTLERVMADLSDMPDWLVALWHTLDAGAKFSRKNLRAGPAIVGTPPQPAPAATPAPPWPGDTLTPPVPSHQRSQMRPAIRPPRPPHLTTLSTTLSADDYTDFEGDEVETSDEECAAHVCRLVSLGVSCLEAGWPFLCVLPGHREAKPSATWCKTNSGHYIYHDWHVRSGDEYWPVPDVFAALVTGKLKRLPKPSRKTWRLRLMVEAGLLDPYPVDMKPLPDDMPRLLRRFCEGFRHLCACKWTYQERAPTMFSDAFAAGWCGIREGSIWTLRRLALAHGFMLEARDNDGRLVYLPGKERPP